MSQGRVSDAIVVVAVPTSWVIYHWRRRDSFMSYFPIVDVGAVDSERPLTVGKVVR